MANEMLLTASTGMEDANARAEEEPRCVSCRDNDSVRTLPQSSSRVSLYHLCSSTLLTVAQLCYLQASWWLHVSLKLRSIGVALFLR